MDVYEELIRERNAGRTCVLATIVNAVGSVPSYATAKLLLRQDGTIVGTVGGGASEAAVIAQAKEVLACGRPKLATFDLRENPRMDIGMVCGGSLNVFIEPIRPAPVAYLFGAGHVGVLTAAAAKLARIDVVVIDDRAEFANAARFPDARAIHDGDIEATFANVKPDANALIFIAGRSHELDARALRWAVGTPASYIGMMGSRRKVQFVYHQLKAEGISDEQLSRVHAPRRSQYRRRHAGRNRHLGRRRDGRLHTPRRRRSSAHAQYVRSGRIDQSEDLTSQSGTPKRRDRAAVLVKQRGRIASSTDGELP